MVPKQVILDSLVLMALAVVLEDTVNIMLVELIQALIMQDLQHMHS